MKKIILLFLQVYLPVYAISQSLVSISPDSATGGQKLNVTITGLNTHFNQASPTYVSFGGDITVDSTKILSNTSIQVNITVPAITTTGDYYISVSDQIDAIPILSNAFHVKGILPPALVSISPDSASGGQTLNVTITGANTHFKQASPTSVYFNGGIVVNSTSITNDLSIQANVTVPSNTVTGNYNVSIENSLDLIETLNSAFHVNGIPKPSLASVVSDSAKCGQTLNVTITGRNTHFSQASGTIIYFTFNQASSTIIVNSDSVINDTTMRANITIPAFADTGKYGLAVYDATDGNITLAGAFYVEGSVHPILSSISPNSAYNGQTLSVSITGSNTHFMQASSTTVTFGGGISINSTSIPSDTLIQCNITVPTNEFSGNYAVTVYNATDGNLALNSAFYINGNTPSSLTSISPAAAKPSQSLNVTITGTHTHFSQASGTSVWFSFNQISSTIVVNSTSVINDTVVEASISIPSDAIIGNYKAIVTNSGEGSLSTDFTVYNNCFSHFITAYNSTDNIFTLTLDSISSEMGTGFLWNFGDDSTSKSETPIHNFARDTIYNVCLRITTSTGDTCSYCQEIGLDSHGNPVLKKGPGFSMNVVLYNGTIEGISASDNSRNQPFILVYPNPANEQININVKQISDFHNAILSVFTIDGQILLRQPLTQNIATIDIGTLAKGAYLIKYTSDEGSGYTKFIK
jgi:hypothetical protein